MQKRPGVQMIGNDYFNPMLITGEKNNLLFEAGISGMADQLNIL